MKKIKLTADDFFRANDRAFMDSMETEKRDLMISLERRSEPECCSMCVFYRNVLDKNGSKICGECALDEDIMITDYMERQICCPL